MANETLGLITCPICGNMEAQVRRCNKGKRTFYYVCRCGKITPNLAMGQEWLKAHSRPVPPPPAAASAAEPFPEPPPPKRRYFLDDLL